MISIKNRHSSKFVSSTSTTLIFTVIDWVNWPHTMHDIHFPFMTFLIKNLSPRLRSQFGHTPNHISVALQKVCLFEVSKVHISEITSKIIFQNFLMGAVTLWLIIVITWLTMMVICRNHLREGVLLLKTTIHVSWLIASIIKVTMMHWESELRRFHIEITIGHGVSFPVFGNFRFLFYWVFFNIKLLVIFIWSWSWYILWQVNLSMRLATWCSCWLEYITMRQI